MIRLHYMKKENRDAKFKEMKAQGLRVRKTSISGQQLHPQYVEDYPNEDIKADNGFGNTYYKTFFAKLYSIQDER